MRERCESALARARAATISGALIARGAQHVPSIT
jgi:hypothetical protein